MAELGFQWTEQKLWWEGSWGCFCSQAHTGTAIRLLSNCKKKHKYCLRAGNGSLDPKHKQERTKHRVFIVKLIIPRFSALYKGRTCTAWKSGKTEQNANYLIEIDLMEGGVFAEWKFPVSGKNKAFSTAPESSAMGWARTQDNLDGMPCVCLLLAASDVLFNISVKYKDYLLLIIDFFLSFSFQWERLTWFWSMEFGVAKWKACKKPAPNPTLFVCKINLGYVRLKMKHLFVRQPEIQLTLPDLHSKNLLLGNPLHCSHFSKDYVNIQVCRNIWTNAF